MNCLFLVYFQNTLAYLGLLVLARHSKLWPPTNSSCQIFCSSCSLHYVISVFLRWPAPLVPLPCEKWRLMCVDKSKEIYLDIQFFLLNNSMNRIICFLFSKLRCMRKSHKQNEHFTILFTVSSTIIHSMKAKLILTIDGFIMAQSSDLCFVYRFF